MTEHIRNLFRRLVLFGGRLSESKHQSVRVVGAVCFIAGLEGLLVMRGKG